MHFIVLTSMPFIFCVVVSLFLFCVCPELQEDAKVEITAKVFHGYNAGEAYKNIDADAVKMTKGREYGYDKKPADS